MSTEKKSFLMFFWICAYCGQENKDYVPACVPTCRACGTRNVSLKFCKPQKCPNRVDCVARPTLEILVFGYYLEKVSKNHLDFILTEKRFIETPEIDY